MKPCHAVGITCGFLMAGAGPIGLHAQDVPRAQGLGFSVPIPLGFSPDSTFNEYVKGLRASGGLALVRQKPSSVVVVIARAPRDPRHESTLEHCQADADHLAESEDATLEVEDVRIVSSPFGPLCELAIRSPSDNHAALSTAVIVERNVWVVTCNYDVRASDVPEILQACREVVSGWRAESLLETQQDSAQEIPGFDPDEYVMPGSEVTLFTDSVLEQLPEVTFAPQPVYPDSLRQANVEGSVVLAAVIDTAGRVERSSIRVVSSTHPAFTQAGADALAGMLFRPGRAQGHPVRVLIQLPITFTLQAPPPRPR